jgi:heterodisulfide reductase subunit B
MPYAYYPGCSLHSTGLEYSLSIEAVFRYLGLELVEVPDWNCCGASSAHSLNPDLALALPARNLALAQEMGKDLVTPCAACYNRLKGADYTLRSDPRSRIEMEKMIGFEYSGDLSIRPLLAVLYEDYGLERVRSRVKHPLNGLKVVPYYGCLLLRPPYITQFDDPDDPQIMGAILDALGAEVRPWSYASECCGGSLSLSRPQLVKELVGKLVAAAREAGAEAMVTACPLCQVNLEMRQVRSAGMPVFYFTELMGLAFGLPEAPKWWRKHLVDPRPLLERMKRTVLDG